MSEWITEWPNDTQICLTYLPMSKFNSTIQGRKLILPPNSFVIRLLITFQFCLMIRLVRNDIKARVKMLTVIYAPDSFIDSSIELNLSSTNRGGLLTDLRLIWNPTCVSLR